MHIAASRTAATGWQLTLPASVRGNLLLFSVTFGELAFLVHETPEFTLVDWIYISQHLLVLAIAFTRRQPVAQDHSLTASAAVVVSYAYPYAQIAFLSWFPGDEASADAGLILVTAAAYLSLASLLALRRSFGVRPALRSLVTEGPYRFVRHPIYLSYVIADIGYCLQEWNVGTVLLVFMGWGALVYRMRAEERVLSQDPGWQAYVTSVPRRLLPWPWRTSSDI